MTKSKKSKSEYPVYQKIAADIAAKIVDKHYQIGEKIYARSSVASQYAVSAETARRAICILSDMKIVETIKGSGVRIVSYEKAVQFVKQFRNVRMLPQNHTSDFAVYGQLLAMSSNKNIIIKLLPLRDEFW